MFLEMMQETYYAMMDNELAEKLSKAGNFGIAEALRQFGKNVEQKISNV